MTGREEEKTVGLNGEDMEVAISEREGGLDLGGLLAERRIKQSVNGKEGNEGGCQQYM
jgi:hypothetical protein